MADAIPRPSARVLFLDGHDRVLLFHAPGLVPVWFTPGGGVHPGEDLAVAAARELREETGNRVSPDAVGPIVATTSGHWTSDKGVRYHAEDFFFLVRASGFEVDVSGMEAFESAMFDSFRWWNIADLETTSDRVLPLNLAGLLRRLLAEGVPAEPVALPWHELESAD